VSPIERPARTHPSDYSQWPGNRPPEEIMTTPSEHENGQSPPEGVDLSKQDPTSEVPFDPYRFGRPDHPIPAEYAPPGYTGPTIPPPAPYGAPAPHPGQHTNPFGNPPGTPYGNPPGTPYGNPPGTPYSNPQQPYQYPPNPYNYGPPPPPGYHAYAQPQNRSGKAVAALVLGILSIVFCWLSVLDVFVVLAVIFGLIALSETRRGRIGGRGMATAGLACAVVGAILATIISVKVFSAINKCGGLSQTSSTSFNRCVQDNF
jgi:hypothetical protein